VTVSDDEQRFLADFFARHPEAKALFDQRKATEQQRQQVFDAMDLPELREAAITSLTSAAGALMNSSQSSTMLSDDWTAKNKNALASYFLEMVENIEGEVENPGGINLAKWFDFYPLSEGIGHDELETVAYESAEVYNAYVRRQSS
jgi:hypothetical protein